MGIGQGVRTCLGHGGIICVLQTLVCVDMTIKSLPALKRLVDKIVRLSRNCFYKIHVCKLKLEKVASQCN